MMTRSWNYLIKKNLSYLMTKKRIDCYLMKTNSSLNSTGTSYWMKNLNYLMTKIYYLSLNLNYYSNWRMKMNWNCWKNSNSNCFVNYWNYWSLNWNCCSGLKMNWMTTNCSTCYSNWKNWKMNSNCLYLTSLKMSYSMMTRNSENYSMNWNWNLICYYYLKMNSKNPYQGITNLYEGDVQQHHYLHELFLIPVHR
jgi:hypothetical protein